MFFDRPGLGERALLVHCFFGGEKLLSDADADADANPSLLHDAEISEFVELVRSAGVSPVCIEVARRKVPTANYFIGSGKVASLCEIVHDHQIEVVLFNHQLSPSQERNLEKELQCRVIDRTSLILDIFAQRARSHVGKLQVELAQLDHISTRLIRGWTHLERQKGGIGLRGPGESQLETDRRLLRERLKSLTCRREKIRAQQYQSKRRRQRADLATVALVGYTNAGKSTLFNVLTESEVYAKDQLFATLDTTLRAKEVAAFGRVILADTVGFVRNLPHKLVEAFKATLEEAAEADLLLHLVDASSPTCAEQIEACDSVLAEIGAAGIPTLLVMNKIDAMDCAQTPRIDRDGDKPWRIWVSAQSGAGLELIDSAIAELLGATIWTGQIHLAPSHGKLRAELFELGAVKSEQIAENGDFLLQLSYQKDSLARCFRSNALELPSQE